MKGFKEIFFINLQLKKIQFFSTSKIANYLSFGLHEGRPGYSPHNRTSTTPEHEISSLFFFLLRVIFVLLGPDPTEINADSYGSGSGPHNTEHKQAIINLNLHLGCQFSRGFAENSQKIS